MRTCLPTLTCLYTRTLGYSLWSILHLSLYSSSNGAHTNTRNKFMDLCSKYRYSTTSFQCASKGVESLDKMDNNKLTRAKGRQGSSSQGNTISNIEADILQVKQAMNDVQAVIERVGQEIKEVAAEIEATKKLLRSKLSPSNKSILTRKLDSLMDDKSALMDKEKFLMDEKKFLMEKEKSSLPHPFVYSIVEDENFPESGGGGKVIFKREWFIKEVADMVLRINKGGKYNSYYWRAPRGSGKSVFLYLIGKELQERGCEVYLLVSPELERIEQKYFHQLAEKAGDKVVVLLIDEVQNNTCSVHWNDLLRERRPKNLLVLGVGLMGLHFLPASPHFGYQYPMNFELFPMFLTAKDLVEVVPFFTKESSQPDEDFVTKLCKQVLAFTNGHFYPFVAIMEHILDAKSKVNLSDISLYLSSQEFRASEAYIGIRRRCSMESEDLLAATYVLHNGRNQGDLEKAYILYNRAFLSPLVMNEVFRRMRCNDDVEAITLDESEGIESCTAQLICAGLRYISENDISDSYRGNIAVEHAVAMKWGSNVRYTLLASNLPDVVVCFQARTGYEESGLPGARLLIDFVFNGRLNLSVEVAVYLHAEGIRERLQRFDDDKVLNGVVLHIDTRQRRPDLVQSLDNGLNDRIYTFFAGRNELYRGTELIATQVSRNLAAPLRCPTY